MEDFSTHGRLLPWPAVRERVSISRTTAWRLQNAGEFPLPVEISAGRVGWREDDIDLWLATRAKRRRRKAAPGLPAADPPPTKTAPPLESESHQPLRFPPRGEPMPAKSPQLRFDF